jgi:hypothetical protein
VHFQSPKSAHAQISSDSPRCPQTWGWMPEAAALDGLATIIAVDM